MKSPRAKAGLLFLCAFLTVADSASAQNYARRRTTAQPTRTWSYGYGAGSDAYSESVRDYSSPPARVTPSRAAAPAKRPATSAPASAAPNSAAAASSAPAATPALSDPLEPSRYNAPSTSSYSSSSTTAPAASSYSAPSAPLETPASESEIADFVAKTKDLRRFPASAMPIKVFFPQRATPQDSTYRQTCLTALNEWAGSSDGLISYKETANRNSANIIIHWRPYNPKTDSQGANGKRMGWTQTSYSGDELRQSDVRLHTLGGALYKDVALHEIGHALGFEHTPWRDSIMNANHDNHHATISQNDKAVLTAVYNKPNAANTTMQMYAQPLVAPAAE